MEMARAELERLLERHALTLGMYVRVHGENLIVGRTEPPDTDPSPHGDRVRLTWLNASTYGLSVKRHTGRWERTPFSGGMKQMVETMLTYMQHLVAPS
jgi:hypothetical protein